MTTTDRVSKLGLLVGCLGLTAGVLAAHGSPASGYELSILASTPMAVWVGLGSAFLTGALVAFTAPARGYRWATGVGLVVSAALCVVGLPLLRGYEYYGAGDALSHVGWAREIAAGTLEPTSLLYPGIHSLTVFVGGVAGVPLTQANLVVVLVAVPLVFLLFVPLAVELVAATPRAYAVGLLAGAMFVPLNNIAVHPTAHPASQAILLFAFVLYLALAYTVGVLEPGRGAAAAPVSDGGSTTHATGSGPRNSHSTVFAWPLTVTGTGALLALASAGIVLVHPQQALNVGLVIAAIASVQFVGRRFTSAVVVDTHRPLYAHTAVLLAAFLVWTPRFERAQGAFVSTIESILRTGPTTGGVVADKSASLTVIGGSIMEIFAKLFGTGAVFSALAVGIVAVALYRHLRGSDTLLGYLAVGLVPVVGVFLVVLAANSGDMYFRYHGFIMVPVTILGAAALARASDWIGGHGSPRVGIAVVAALLLIMTPIGLVAVHPSPYIYQPTQHVTEAELSGYGEAFEHREADVEFTGIRGGPERLVDYHYGTEQARTTLAFPGYSDAIPPAVFAAGNYTETYGDSRYIVITRDDEEREVGLYRGLRYPERGFRALETSPGVNRVRANDEVRLYVVREDGE